MYRKSGKKIKLNTADRNVKLIKIMKSVLLCCSKFNVFLSDFYFDGFEY